MLKEGIWDQKLLHCGATFWFSMIFKYISWGVFGRKFGKWSPSWIQDFETVQSVIPHRFGPFWLENSPVMVRLRIRWCYTWGRKWSHIRTVQHTESKGSKSAGSIGTPQLKISFGGRKFWKRTWRNFPTDIFISTKKSSGSIVIPFKSHDIRHVKKQKVTTWGPHFATFVKIPWFCIVKFGTLCKPFRPEHLFNVFLPFNKSNGEENI